MCLVKEQEREVEMEEEGVARGGPEAGETMWGQVSETGIPLNNTMHLARTPRLHACSDAWSAA